MNRIKKQVLDIRFNSEQGSFLWQKQLSAFYHQQLVPLIDGVLTEFSTDDEIIGIEQLTIDLGQINPDQWAQDFVDKTRVQLPAALLDRLEPTHADGIYRQSPQHRALSVIEFYLRHGTLPWWAADQDIRRILTQQIKQSSPALAQALRPLLQESANAAFRMASLLEEEELWALAALLIGATRNDSRKMYQQMVNNIPVMGLSVPPRRTDIGGYFLQACAQWDPAQTDHQQLVEMVRTWLQAGDGNPTLVSRILHDLSQKDLAEAQQKTLIQAVEDIARFKPDTAKALVRKLCERNQRPAFFQLFRLVDDKNLSRLAAGITPAISSEKIIHEIFLQISASQTITPELRNNIWLVLFRVLTKTKSENAGLEDLVSRCRQELGINAQTPGEIPREGLNDIPEETWEGDTSGEYYIHNSGLIIVWPFLAAFFERLGLLAEQQLNNPPKAVLLLHYLVSEQRPQSEHELLLNKVLCAAPLSEVIDLDGELSAPEQAAIQELLQAVIAHWAALKNVSIAWLREVFLKRAGVLKRREGNWLLQIEGAAPDVLLKKLPWILSTVKLPWKQELITVQWRY